LIDEYDKLNVMSKSKEKWVNDRLEEWENFTNFLYSWNVKERHKFLHKLFGRDEATILVIPSIYREDIEKLYEKMRKETSYTEKRKIFAEIKKYTVPIPIWMVKISQEDGFPIVDIFYDKTYGVRKEIDCIL